MSAAPPTGGVSLSCVHRCLCYEGCARAGRRRWWWWSGRAHVLADEFFHVVYRLMGFVTECHDIAEGVLCPVWCVVLCCVISPSASLPCMCIRHTLLCIDSVQ